MDDRLARREDIIAYYARLHRKARRMTQTGEMRIVQRRAERDYEREQIATIENPCSRVVYDPVDSSVHYLDDPDSCCAGSSALHRRLN